MFRTARGADDVDRDRCGRAVHLRGHGRGCIGHSRSVGPGGVAAGGRRHRHDAVTVPATWPELATAPDVVLDTALPQVRVSSRPGGPAIHVAVGVYIDDLEQQVCDEWYIDDCQPHEVAGLRGVRWFGEECCAGPGRWLTFVANPTAGQHVTVELTFSADDPEQPDPELLDTVASSVEVLAEPFPAEWVVSATELAPPLPNLWPYGDFHDVPQLGTEPVRGSGCGADGSIGEVIPDGLWAGTLSYVPDEDHWEVNLVCVYSGEPARQADLQRHGQRHRRRRSRLRRRRQQSANASGSATEPSRSRRASPTAAPMDAASAAVARSQARTTTTSSSTPDSSRCSTARRTRRGYASTMGP